MKKSLLIATFVACGFLAKAQSTKYHAFKVDVDFGYAIPSSGSTGSNGVKAGATFTIEPHYRLSDAFAVGLRIEGAALAYASPNGSGGYDNAKAAILTSYCATGEYYLSNNGFRPFVGGGVGFFTQSALKLLNSSYYLPSSTGAGFFPRVGFEAGHFRMSGAYNIVGHNNSYLAFTIGAFFGGGKK